MATVHPDTSLLPEESTPQGARGDCQALLSVLRCGKGRGLAALSIIDRGGAAGGEHFIPFAVDEAPSLRGRDYVYVGLGAALDRLRSLNVRRVLIQVDDAQLADELAKKIEPHRDLTLLYILAGCKLNEFANAKVVAVPAERLNHLRAKADSLANVLCGSASKSRRRSVPLPLAV